MTKTRAPGSVHLVRPGEGNVLVGGSAQGGCEEGAAENQGIGGDVDDDTVGSVGHGILSRGKGGWLVRRLAGGR